MWISRKVYCFQGTQLNLILLDLHTATIFFVWGGIEWVRKTLITSHVFPQS